MSAGGAAGGSKAPGQGRAADRTSRNIGLGCLMTVIGFFSGGMVAVLLGRFIEAARRSPSCTGLPMCNWYLYVLVGGILGAVSLPTLVLWRLRAPSAAPDTQERG